MKSVLLISFNVLRLYDAFLVIVKRYVCSTMNDLTCVTVLISR